MIIVMEKSSLDPQIEYIANQITELGLKAHVIRGTERTVIAAVGDERKIKVESFESYPGVAEVLPILAPYKMASREVRTDHTQMGRWVLWAVPVPWKARSKSCRARGRSRRAAQPHCGGGPTSLERAPMRSKE